MRQFLLALFCFVMVNGYSQTIAPKIKKLRNDTVIWRSDSLLTVESFKSRAKGNDLGFSCIGIFLYPTEVDGVLKFGVEAVFVKSKSYITKSSEYVLKHEQLHFDICELYARMLRKKIAEKDFTKVKDVVGEVKNLYNKFSGDMQREETKYDNDTQHGINAAKQQVWYDKTQTQLKALDQYASTIVDIVKK